jgi:DNA/RNA endonuclease YhcR with UshA esterase domain
LKIHCSKIHQIKEMLPFKKHSQNSEEKIYTNVFQENYLSNLKSKIPVLKRVPKAARPLVSNELTNVINDVVEKNTDVTWYKLFLFTYAVLQLPQ